MKSLSIKEKSLIKKFKFLKSDLEWRQVIVDESRQDFLDEVSKKVEDMHDLLGINQPDLNDSIEEDLQNDQSNSLENKSLKKIYRDICKLTHPDKDETSKYEDLFRKASEAYENLNVLELFLICDDLNIEYEISKENMQLVNKNIESLENEIEKVSGTFIFKFNECDSEKEKESVVNAFIITNKIKNSLNNK